MKISLIRHGMTEANEKHLYCGKTDIPLSENGRAGLFQLKETVSYPQAKIFITSGMRRTAETLQILYGREPDMIIEEFMEMDFGDFEMKSYEELKSDEKYSRWINDIENVSCPNGESRKRFENRVFAGLNKLCGIKKETAAVICHGGTIVSLMNRFFPGEKHFYEWQPGYGRGYTIDTNAPDESIFSI